MQRGSEMPRRRSWRWCSLGAPDGTAPVPFKWHHRPEAGNGEEGQEYSRLVPIQVRERSMKVHVLLEADPKGRRELQERLTAMLKNWFGKPEANAKYAEQAEVLDGYVAMSDRVQRGLLLLKYHSPSSAEVYWMGVDPTCHRAGIGRALMEAAVGGARVRGVRYLFVATLPPDDPYEPYQRSRRFYEAMGFVYVLQEQFSADPENPMAYYLKQL